jgi:K+-sensing histidine kinase KdpD
VAPQGGIQGAVLAFRESTEQRAEAVHGAHEQQAKEDQQIQRLRVLAGGIAHNFNNLFAVVLGNAELATAVVGAGLPPGWYAAVQITDTGCGMDEAMLAQIFDPFFTTKFTGRGLGLPAVLGIVREHGGALTVQSAPGQGTTFTVFLASAYPAGGRRYC